MAIPKSLKNFLAEFSIVTVSLGIIIGAASLTLIRSLVDNMIMPIVTPFIPQTTWEAATLNLGPVVLRWGLFVGDVINFTLLILLAYVFVKKILKYSRPKS